MRRDGTPTIAVAEEGVARVPGVNLFAVQAQVVPEQIAQTIVVRISPMRQMVKTWQARVADVDVAAQEEMAGTKA